MCLNLTFRRTGFEKIEHNLAYEQKYDAIE